MKRVQCEGKDGEDPEAGQGEKDCESYSFHQFPFHRLSRGRKRHDGTKESGDGCYSKKLEVIVEERYFKSLTVYGSVFL
jgi:hypothetical protein